jgi:preprotein translocase subunit SecF
MRYELVPKKVKEDEFWRNYFYRVGLAKQSFELAPVAPITSTATAKPTNSNASANRSMDEVEDGGGEQEEEFLSEQQEASSRDLQEADEAMKKLGLAKNDAEWEAELEGELNEYEMVGGEEGEDLNEDQIQALLEAEK